MPPNPFRCDFCRAETSRVRRVALDQGYDRLSQRHAVRYACEPCSRKKDRDRAPAAGEGGPVDAPSPRL